MVLLEEHTPRVCISSSTEVSGPDFTVTEDNLRTAPGSRAELQSLSS